MDYKDYQELLPQLPKQPGVYRFMSENGEILYVGKAKSLKARVSSYFGSKKHMPFKTRNLVKHADHLEFTIVESEHDALLLENSLIKKHQPRYNVMLKDGKTYTYICVKKERFPRVFFTRKLIRDGSEYFGPYTSKYKARIVLDMIRNLFPLRTCTLNLSESNIRNGKFNVCLEFHIKNCMGPCESYESEEDYMDKIQQVRNMLKGHFHEVKKHIRKEMKRSAEQLEFEKAQNLKIKLDALEDYQSKSTVVSATVKDVDVFTIAMEEKEAYVNHLKVVNGAVINSYTVELTKNLDEDPSDLLSHVILDFKDRKADLSHELILPFSIDDLGDEFQIIVPRRGDKRKLLELSEKNAKFFQLQEKQARINRQRKQTSAERILKTLKEDLHMGDMPMHIECFDNSNIQGSHPVASCVVFKNAKPSKADYRHYNIKTVEGPDDFASMREIVFRRYRRLLQEDEHLPQLVIIDGGKGQLSAAMESVKELGLEDKMTVIGIAKKLEEIYFPNDPIPLHINKKSEGLKLIQKARNEAHRFAIGFHRNQRSRNFTSTELTQIDGVGMKTADKLLKAFGSVKKIQAASLEEIAKQSNHSIALKIKNYFNPEQEG